MGTKRPQGLKLQGSCRTCACYVPNLAPIGTGQCYGAPPQMFPAQGPGGMGFLNQVPTVPGEWVCGQWRRVGNGGGMLLDAPAPGDDEGEGKQT